MAGPGPIARGTYRTPDGFVPPFAFDLPGDGWQSVAAPDEFGFVLATRSVFQPDVLLGFLDRVAAPADAFAPPDVAGIRVAVEQAPGTKCARCWRVLPEVGHNHAHPTLCERCADAVDHGAPGRDRAAQ